MNNDVEGAKPSPTNPDHAPASERPAGGDDYTLNNVYIDFVDYSQRSLLERWQPVTDWWNARDSKGVDPYSKYTNSKIGTTIEAFGRSGARYSGVNFGSQEYLNLATDLRVIRAATNAASAYGVHSAGSATLMGLTKATVELEARVASFVGMKDATVFPTGWGAGYGAIRTLIAQNDHIIIDVLAHACLQEGARAATANVHTFPHISTDGVKRRLSRIRKDHPNAGILVVTETVFSMDSDVPDVKALQALCREYDATLLVDVAHDLGAIGPTGRGYLEIQGMHGKVDLVMGSFSKTFASNGGFVATNHPALKLALRFGAGPLTFTNSLSPVQAEVVLKCFELVDSPEGNARRSKLMQNILHMRAALHREGFQLLGQPSAIIPVVLGDNAISRLMTKYALNNGAIVNLVEYPAVSKNSCRWRVQVMADHSHEQIDRFVAVAVEARAHAKALLGRI